MKSGIITVGDDPVLLYRCEMALPAEHSIVAVRRIEHLCCVEWLVEGPYMPEHDGDHPPHSLLMITLEQKADTGAVFATGHFDHAPDKIWVIGYWPDWMSCSAWLSGESH